MLATLSWAGGMALSRLLFCEGGNCTQHDRYGMDASLVLSLIGLAVAAATLLGAVFRRWLGLAALCCHIVVFAVNLAFFWGLADSPWVFIPLAGLAAAAGYAAVGRSAVRSPRNA